MVPSDGPDNQPRSWLLVENIRILYFILLGGASKNQLSRDNPRPWVEVCRIKGHSPLSPTLWLGRAGGVTLPAHGAGLSQVAGDLGDSADANTRWIERRERPGQVRAINYLGVCVEGVAGSEGAGRERRESERKKYGDAALAQRVGGRGAERVRVCQSARTRYHR